MLTKTKVMETKPEKRKGPWHIARESVQDAVIAKAKEMGYSHVTTSLISPKTLRDNPDHVLMMSYEFTGKHVFILFDRDWKELVDINNLPTKELVLYTVPACKNYQEVYASADLHEDGPYIVETSELKPLVHKPGFLKVTVEKEEQLDLDFEYSDSKDEQDEHINSMTIKDLYAIMQSVPVSNKEWLNDVIKKTNVKRSNRSRN